MPVLWSFLIVVPVMAVLGYGVQRTLIQSALDRSVLTTLIVMLGLSVVIENGLLQFVNANSHSLGVNNVIVSGAFTITSQIRLPYLLSLVFGVAVVILLGLQYFLSRSRYGRMIRAVADDKEAAQLSGIDYRHVFGIAAAIAFGTAALAGIAIMRGVTLTEELFRKSGVPGWLRPMCGGLAVGVLALNTPAVLSSGHGALDVVIEAPYRLSHVGLLVLLKSLASAISIGSGFRG